MAFDYDAALKGARSAMGRRDFSEHAADYAILVTENKEHFPYEKIKTPKELMEG